jgi:hypothetical protein
LGYIAFCKIITTQISKYLNTRIYKYLSIPALHTCAHHDQ